MTADGMPPRQRVAITGIGLLTPLGIGTEATWASLLNGESGVDVIKSFDASRLRVQIAAEVRDFVATDFVSVKDSRRLDRVLCLARAAAAMAVDDASPSGLDRDAIATVVGSAIGGAHSIEIAVLADVDDPRQVSPFFVPNSIPNMPAAVVAQQHGFRGPSAAPATACSASTDALGQGFRLVRDGYAAACLAGGVEACIVSSIVAGFANMRALSARNDQPAAASRPFDADRDGFVMAEGAAMLFLEPLDTALARGAHVYAEVCGFGQTNDALSMTAPDPRGGGAARAMALALRDAGLRPSDVDYINAHATSTRMADASESAAIRAVFGEHSDRLMVSSTKSMTGHLLGAAGATEAAVCALSIDRQQVPPTINYTTPDPACDLDYVPNKARTRPVTGAMSNSFAFGGHNSSLVFRRP